MPGIVTSPEPISVSDIAIRVKRTFGDESGVQIDDADILRWANDGQLDIARKTQCLVKTEYFNSGQGIHELPAPVGFLFFVRATFGGRLLSSISYQELDKRYPHRAESYPNGTPEYISFIGSNLHLYPAPDTAGTENIVLTYIARPVTLVTTASVLEIPDRFYETLVRFCLMRAKELDGDWEAAQVFQKSYESELTANLVEVTNVDHSSYPVIREIEDY